MLKQLSIQNIAIAENVNVEFESGLNVITGETGAGKSILVEALALLRGSKVDVALIRSGSDSAQVTASFALPSSSPVLPLLEELGIPKNMDDAGEVVIRKSIHRNAKHRSFINDVPVSSKSLHAVAAELIDISSQFENQQLLDATKHTFYLDHFVGIQETSQKLTENFSAVFSLLKEIADIDEKIKQHKRELSLYQYELNEIENANLSAAEWEEVQGIVSIGTRAAQAQKICSDIFDSLSEAENSCLAQLKFCTKSLEKLQKIAGETKLPVSVEEFREANALLENIVFQMHRTSSIFDIDEEKILNANERLETYNKALSKFGPTIDDVLLYRDRCADYLNQGSDLEGRLDTLSRSAVKLIKESLQMARLISKKRNEGTARLCKKIENELCELGMPKTKFVCALEQDEKTSNRMTLHSSVAVGLSEGDTEDFSRLSKAGFEQAHFLMSANVGIEPQPIEKVASGGELSRTMLAIKNVLFASAPLSVFVFDEIDTGVSGQIASKIGRKLAEFCKNRQSICITHLPQVACFASTHFVAEKSLSQNKTTASIKRASEQERLQELAKMLSGEKLTRESLAQAKMLVSEAREKGLR